MEENDRQEKEALNQNTVTNVLYRQVSLALSIFGVLFGAYLFISSPARDNDTAIQLQDQRIISQKLTIDTLTETQQNDITEVKGELVGLRSEIQLLTNAIIKLQTVIEERVPVKK
jgi:hypothetical protein